MSKDKTIKQYMDEFTEKMKEEGYHAEDELKSYGTTYLSFLKYKSYHSVEVKVEYTDGCDVDTLIPISAIFRQDKTTTMAARYAKPKGSLFEEAIGAVEDALNPHYPFTSAECVEYVENEGGVRGKDTEKKS